MQRTLCNLFYQPLHAVRPYRRKDSEEGVGFNTHFDMPAAPRDGYELLTVYDMEETFQFSSEAPRTTLSKDTTGEKVANDLITQWRGNVAHPNAGMPGVFICEDNDVKDASGKVIRPATEPSDRERKEWKEIQTRHCEGTCLEASDLKRKGKSNLIKPQKHHAAAEWLGKTYDWMEAVEQAFVNECPVCGTAVKAGKFKCAACGETFDPVGYEKWKKSLLDDQLVAEKLKNAALKANPNIPAEELELIGVGAPVEAKKK